MTLPHLPELKNASAAIDAMAEATLTAVTELQAIQQQIRLLETIRLTLRTRAMEICGLYGVDAEQRSSGYFRPTLTGLAEHLESQEVITVQLTYHTEDAFYADMLYQITRHLALEANAALIRGTL